MTTQDILFLSLSIGFLLLVSYLIILIKRIGKTLDRLDPVLDNLHNTTGDIRYLKDTAKSTLLNTASMLLGLLFGRKK